MDPTGERADRYAREGDAAASTMGPHEAERHALLAAAERARREAEDAVLLRDRVLIAVSHDLRTPLTAIQGNAQMLVRHADRAAAHDPALGAALTHAVDAIVAAARRLSRWSDEMTDVARLQIGQTLPLDRRPIDLVAMAHRVAEEYRGQSELHPIRVRASVPELVGSWDAPRLERVLHNLVGNAIKYSADGGDVELALDVIRPLAVTRRDALNPNSWAELRVLDTGIGIPAAELASVFELFTRGSNVQFVTGSGVGLAAARHIVELHGGTIGVASQEGAGTTVTVRLPLATPQDPAPPDGPSLTPQERR